MEKVLMISYQFPPDTGSIQRILNFIKYLPKFNYLPIVLTHKSKYEQKYNNNIIIENPNIQIHRIGNPNSIINYIHRILSKIESNNKKINQNEINQNVKISKSKTRKVFKWLKTFIYWPDIFIWWVPFALIKSIKLIKKEKIKIVYIVTPPHSAALIGILLKIILNIKVVIDFRDPWLDDDSLISPTIFHLWLHKISEKYIIKKLDSVITTTVYHSNFLKEKYLIKNKVNTITNGFSRLDFDFNDTIGNVFTIVYTGNFDSTRNPNSLFEAIHNINLNHPEIFSKNSIKFFGNYNHDIQIIIEKYNLEKIVVQNGMLNYSETIKEMKKASILLLIVHNEIKTANFSIPAKLFEYMATGRPILSISPKGASQIIIEKFDLGKTFLHDEINLIESAILDYYNDFIKGNLSTKYLQSNILNQFDREFLTKELSVIFDKQI